MDEMSSTTEELIQSIQSGFIDKSIHAKKEYCPQLVHNDKENAIKVLTTILSELQKCESFWFSVAFVTTSGVASLINILMELEEKGVQGKILVSQYLNFTQPEALKRLSKFKNIELKIATDSNFHSKGYLFKTGELYNLVIGSSNLTANALCTNKEWNLKVSATDKSDIIYQAINEFTAAFNNAVVVDENYIEQYNKLYQENLSDKKSIGGLVKIAKTIKPNRMQKDALLSLEAIRNEGKKKALLISATGTGKTYLSAFDVKKFNPKRFLFIVHRANIAHAAMTTFQNIFGSSKSMGMFSGNKKEIDCDFIFSTVQTIAKQENLEKFNPDWFDYIVIDESHRAGAESYQRILEHFTPQFLLGMTATPERTDGLDIFGQFDHTIAYEIRLHAALDENMLCSFHYYGITDISVDGELLDEKATFNQLTSPERVKKIIEKAKLYGCDNGVVRGLIFCSKVDECRELSKQFNQQGFSAIALTGDNSEQERSRAINRLESDDPEEKLDYIFTVDIFNEGIDIPRVNQVIMLRPTQSAIVFVQQLGRGLRKVDDKEYLTVIDFIGNYNNNYLVPIALYGDTSYNKDTLRKLISTGSSLMPGESTINFDKITKERIFNAIDSANMQMKKDLVKDYQLLKFKLGRIPMMMDFIEHGSRDPQLYVKYSKSYYNFVFSQESELENINEDGRKLLELFSNEINNSKRVEESIILSEIIREGKITIDSIKKYISDNYGYHFSDVVISSCINNLNFGFIRESKNGKKLSVKQIYNISNVKVIGDEIVLDDSLVSALESSVFKEYLIDNINYSIYMFNEQFELNKYFDGFVLYRKYSRKDVFRILNWEENPVAQNVGGYIVSKDKSNCPIFVNYHKEEHISSSTKYEDSFINNEEFEWMSKSNRTLTSPDVSAIANYKEGLRLPLFIKKSNDEGTEFYYMGDITPIENSFEETTILDDNNKRIPIVKVLFSMNQPVEDALYKYITNQ